METKVISTAINKNIESLKYALKSNTHHKAMEEALISTELDNLIEKVKLNEDDHKERNIKINAIEIHHQERIITVDIRDGGEKTKDHENFTQEGTKTAENGIENKQERVKTVKDHEMDHKESVKEIKEGVLKNLDWECTRNQKGESQNVAKNTTVDQNANDVFQDIEPKTEIQEFFHQKNVLITGATGFLGKILVEKLLRSCPGIENLYLLVRQKKGKDIYTRIEEIFDDPVFNRLKETIPKFRHKIVVIPGDCDAIGLGLTLTDRQILADKVNVIFHVAATVRFDEHLRVALCTNVRAPLHLLRLCRDMKKLDVLMHVSTAYSNSHLTRIDENFYPCAADSEQLFTLMEKLTDKEIDELLPSILDPWPNTYTFTKALAEKELRLNAGNIPLGIFRPAIVTSTYNEPLKCWIDNMYGPTGVVVGAATGVLRTMQCDISIGAEIVPVDLVVNGLIAASRYVHAEYKQSTPPAEPPIFNYVSSVENRITWRDFMAYNMKFLEQYPLSAAIWYTSLTANKSAFMNKLCEILWHLIPATLVDGLAICVGQKPKLLKVYRKIHKFSSVLSYFCTHEIAFCNKRTQELWESTSSADKKLFPFSMAQMNWENYFSNYIRGIRKHIFKEAEETIKKAKKKWRRLYFYHQVVRIIFIALAVVIIWTLLLKMFSFVF